MEYLETLLFFALKLFGLPPALSEVIAEQIVKLVKELIQLPADQVAALDPPTYGHVGKYPWLEAILHLTLSRLSVPDDIQDMICRIVCTLLDELLQREDPTPDDAIVVFGSATPPAA